MSFSKSMEIKTIGIVGYGAFGQHIHELINRFAPVVTVKISSRRSDPDGQTFFNIEEVCACDAVVLTCAIADYESELRRLLPYFGADTVIIDVATVKKHTVDLLQRLAPDQLYLCTHPMFGPESYKKTGGDVTGYRIVVTDKTIAEGDYQQLKSFLTDLGFAVIEMTADEHDQLLADTLFITHYIGQTVTEAGFGRTMLDSVSFGSLMNAVESVAKDTKLFQDVYKFNPYCQNAAERFHTAQDKVFAALPKTD